MSFRPFLASTILRAAKSSPSLWLVIALAGYLILPFGSGWEAEVNSEWEINYSTAQILGSSFSNTPLLRFVQRQVQTRDVLLSGALLGAANGFPLVSQPWIGLRGQYGNSEYFGLHWNAMFLSEGSRPTGHWNFSSVGAAFWKRNTYPGELLLVASERKVSGYRGHDASIYYGKQWSYKESQKLFIEVGPGYYRESVSVQSMPLVGASPTITPAEFLLESWTLGLRLGSRWEYTTSRVEMNLKFAYGPLAELRSQGIYSGELEGQLTSLVERSQGTGTYQEALGEMKIGFSLGALGMSENTELLFGLQIVARDMKLRSVNNDYLFLPGSSNTTVLFVVLGNRIGQTGEVWSGNQGRIQVSVKGRF